MPTPGSYYESEFEKATVELLQNVAWKYTYGDELHRRFTDPIIEDDLRTFLSAKYARKGLTEAEMDNVVANLRNVGGQNDYYAAQNAFLLYRDGYDFTYSDNRDAPFKMQYIDFEHPCIMGTGKLIRLILANSSKTKLLYYFVLPAMSASFLTP